MANLQGRAIANAECSDCGKPVKIKVSKGSKAYYYCPHVSAQTGEYCGNRKWWGVDASQNMQRDYLAARNSPTPAPTPAPETEIEDDNREFADVYDQESEDGDGEFEDDEREGDGWSLYG